MLQLTIPETEYFDYQKQEFVYRKAQTIQLEHSLVSISKWESKWKKAFLGKQPITREETIDYIRCMTITQNVPPDTYYRLTPENIEEINRYISDSMTASIVPEVGSKGSSDVVTSEIIYYWMISLNIPAEYRKWHLNRLLSLIKVCSFKNQPPKKMSKKDILRQNAALNAARTKRLNTRG